MTKIPTVVLCGLGGYGNEYLAALLDPAHAGRVRLIGGVDPAPGGCRHLAELERRRIPVVPGLESIQQTARPDLVVISSPIHHHADQCCQALAMGCHVLCEKPVAATVADGMRMERQAAAAGRTVAVGFQWSFSPAITALKTDILSGRFGRALELKTMVLTPRPRSYYRRNDWAGRIRTSSGSWVWDSPLMNATSHHLHNMLYCLGDAPDRSALPSTVEAELHRANAIENHDTAALRLTMGNGARLLFLTSHAGQRDHDPLFEFRFEHAIIHGGAEGIRAEARNGQRIEYGSPEDQPMAKLWAMAEVARGTGAPPPCPLSAAMPHLRVVEHIQRSYPVNDIPESAIIEGGSGADSKREVIGLDEALTRCFKAAALPAELSLPWARGAGSTQFPGDEVPGSDPDLHMRRHDRPGGSA